MKDATSSVYAAPAPLTGSTMPSQTCTRAAANRIPHVQLIAILPTPGIEHCNKMPYNAEQSSHFRALQSKQLHASAAEQLKVLQCNGTQRKGLQNQRNPTRPYAVLHRKRQNLAKQRSSQRTLNRPWRGRQKPLSVHHLSSERNGSGNIHCTSVKV